MTSSGTKFIMLYEEIQKKRHLICEAEITDVFPEERIIEDMMEKANDIRDSNLSRDTWLNAKEEIIFKI